MYNTIVYIPSLKEKWRVRPYNTFHQKEICKALYEEDDDLFVNIINDILIDCIHPKHNFYQLTLIDKLLLLLKIRCAAAGAIMEFESELEDKKKYNINYNFYDIYVNLHKIIESIEPLKIVSDSFEIQCYLPNVNQEIIINNKIKNNITHEDILYYFISFIKINNHTFIMDKLTELERLQLLNMLPASIIKNIQIYIDNIITKLNELVIYNLFDKKISLSVVGNLYTDYCKFIVKDNLHSIYQEIYILNKHINLSSEYVEQLLPIERNIYIASLRKENKSSNEEALPSGVAAIPQEDLMSGLDEFREEMGG